MQYACCKEGYTNFGNYVGELMAPEEVIVAEHLTWDGLNADLDNILQKTTSGVGK